MRHLEGGEIFLDETRGDATRARAHAQERGVVDRGGGGGHDHREREAQNDGQ